MRRSDTLEALHISDEAGTELPQTGDEMPARMSKAAVNIELDQILREAIQTKHLLHFRYKGQQRTVEPHDYGTQNGIVRLFCWQVGGHSSGRIPGWRMFDVEGIDNCEMLDKHFAGNREVHGKHHQWNEVFIRVEPPE
jgi:predicted DNA-binding transcriptional regulator YafY